MKEITLQKVRKTFGANAILEGLDLEAGEGEFLVVVGPSGCGKTTLLRLIAGLEQADSGEIFLGGRRVTDLPARDRDLAMVFQTYALYPHMSVRENLAFGLTLRRLPPAEVEARVAEAAGLLELTPFLDRSPASLSGGQRQRVAIGRAIVRHPRIFLFDEPLSNLDAALRVQMRGELARLHKKLGATIVYVTHDQVEAMTLATRLAAFDGGRLQQVGPPLELYRRPANRFVAGFLGSPSMNFLPVSAGPGGFAGRGFSLPAVGDLAGLRGDCLLGLRPQDLRVGRQGPFSGQVEALERLGFEGYAFLRTEAGLLGARFEDDVPLSVGDQVRAAPAGDVLHVFSASEERALRHPPEGAQAPELSRS